MLTFLALYRGTSLATAELVAVSIDPDLVADVAGKLLAYQPGTNAPPSEDPALQALGTGKQHALKAVRAEATRLAHEGDGVGEEDHAAL